MPLTPGPSTLRAPFPALPSIINGTPFSNAGAPVIAALAAGHTLLDDRLRTIGSLEANDLAGDFSGDVAPALVALDQLVAPGADPDLVESVSVITETVDNMLDLATTLPSPFDDDDAPGVGPLPDPPGGQFD